MPENSMVNLGIVHMEQGQHEAARSCFVRALELQPDLPGFNVSCLGAPFDIGCHRCFIATK
jgi:Tfp pilus assembly protein PilF